MIVANATRRTQYRSNLHGWAYVKKVGHVRKVLFPIIVTVAIRNGRFTKQRWVLLSMEHHGVGRTPEHWASDSKHYQLHCCKLSFSIPTIPGPPAPTGVFRGVCDSHGRSRPDALCGLRQLRMRLACMRTIFKPAFRSRPVIECNSFKGGWLHPRLPWSVGTAVEFRQALFLKCIEQWQSS